MILDSNFHGIDRLFIIILIDIARALAKKSHYLVKSIKQIDFESQNFILRAGCIIKLAPLNVKHHPSICFGCGLELDKATCTQRSISTSNLALKKVDEVNVFFNQTS